jgi:hypothetical protein
VFEPHPRDYVPRGYVPRGYVPRGYVRQNVERIAPSPWLSSPERGRGLSTEARIRQF